jgi:hypothetical protein
VAGSKSAGSTGTSTGSTTRQGPSFTTAGPTGVEVRLPTLEVYLATHGSVFAERGRSLTLHERELAFPIFGNALNYGAVRIAVAPIANAPTTLGNTIRISELLGRTGIPEHTLIHELSHIWQFQTRGTRYISNSLCNQVSGMIFQGDRNAAYRLSFEDIAKAKSIDRLSAEQQATLIELWFMDAVLPPSAPSAAPIGAPIPDYHLRQNPVAQSMLREVQAAEPLSIAEIIDEAAFGPGQRPLAPGSPGEPSTPLVPLLRIEF